jgi:putative phosphonate metabolism protein
MVRSGAQPRVSNHLLRRPMTDPRFAIYFTPPPNSRLARFGAAMLGYDCDSAREVAQLAVPGIDPTALAGAAAEPRRYGFHATLMAPFHLDAKTSEAALAAHLETFAARRTPAKLGRLVVGLIGGFVALIPAAPAADVVALAAECVRAFADYRAPLAPADRQRRITAGLTPAQIALLDRWGYPYVLDEFRFHMTLTGSLPATRREPWRAALAAAFAGAADDPVLIDAVSLVRQDDRGARFRVIARQPLGG